MESWSQFIRTVFPLLLMAIAFNDEWVWYRLLHCDPLWIKLGVLCFLLSITNQDTLVLWLILICIGTKRVDLFEFLIIFALYRSHMGVIVKAYFKKKQSELTKEQWENACMEFIVFILVMNIFDGIFGVYEDPDDDE